MRHSYANIAMHLAMYEVIVPCIYFEILKGISKVQMSRSLAVIMSVYSRCLILRHHLGAQSQELSLSIKEKDMP